MEFMARCGRCGALVKTRRRQFADGTIAYYTPCAVVTQVSSNDVPVRDGCEYTVLCPDCMGQLNKWLAGEFEGPQEAADSAGDDDVKALARDMARGLVSAAKENGGDQAVACGYFGYWGVPCIGCGAATCPAFARGREGCFNVMSDDVGKRCKALGIDLEEGEDARQ